MHLFQRTISRLFSSAAMSAALLLAGCNDDAPEAPTPPMPPVTSAITAAPQDGMPAALVLWTDETGAFVKMDSTVNQDWADHWEQEAQPHEAQLMQDSANVALFQNFLRQFDDVKDASITDKAKAVNDAVNKYVTYTSDDALYGRSDYWASPIETLKTKRGDCEDYAILKYYLLKALGVPDNRLFIAGVNAEGKNDPADHALLIVNVAETAAQQSYLALDNGDTAATDITDFRYSYYEVFNDSGYWGYKADYNAMAAADPVKSENNGRVVEKDGALIIDGGKVVVQKDGAVLVDGAVVTGKTPAPAKPVMPS